MRKLTSLLVLGFLLVNTEIYACSCIGERTVKEEISYSDAVVVGKIVSQEFVTLVDSEALKMFKVDSTNFNRLSFERTFAKYELVLTHKYKGKITSDTLEIYTGVGNGDCGVRFKIGQTYVVYAKNETYFAQKNNELRFPKGKNLFWTDQCSRTSEVDEKEIREIERYRRRN